MFCSSTPIVFLFVCFFFFFVPLVIVVVVVVVVVLGGGFRLKIFLLHLSVLVIK